MEQRTYRGVLDWAGRRTAPMEITMQISDPNGLKSGRCMIDLPIGFVASGRNQRRAEFLTETGEAFELLATRITGTGQVAFLTSGRVPEPA